VKQREEAPSHAGIETSGVPKASYTMRFSRTLVTLTMPVCVVLACCTRTPPPNVVLIVADTLRADRLGSYGNQRGLTPFLDELASQGTVFRNAYSTTSYTVPAVSSLFTSRYPSQHGVTNADSMLGDAEVTIAEQLSDAGYASAAFSANMMIDAKWGYGQGFQSFFSMRLLKMRAYTIRQRVRTWLDERPRGYAAPLFLYLHYFDTHGPYEPETAYRKQFQLDAPAGVDEKTAKQKVDTKRWNELNRDEVALLASLYDAEVAAFDAQLRMQFDELRDRGVLDNAIVIFTADHGEGFYEHREMGHGNYLYNEQIHIPLIIIAPGRSPSTVREPVSLVDIAPTVLELAQQPSAPTFEGRSLVGLLGRSAIVSWLRNLGIPLGGGLARPCLFELERMSSPFDLRYHTFGIIDGSMKLLEGRDGKELYMLASDPGETVPHPATDGKAEALRATLETQRARLQQRAVNTAETKPLDEGTKEKLRALGYDLH
jgi:arylsulfatase A-like enzyme